MNAYINECKVDFKRNIIRNEQEHFTIIRDRFNHKQIQILNIYANNFKTSEAITVRTERRNGQIHTGSRDFNTFLSVIDKTGTQNHKVIEDLKSNIKHKSA